MMKLVIVSAILLISYMSGLVIAYSGSDCDLHSYYKPHPSDCALFFQCSPNGTYILFTCPHNLHFNPILNVCDYPHLAGCSGDDSSEPTTNPDDTTDNSPEECNTDEYFPHETDCEAFYRCISGSFILIYCPKGTQFNISSKGCESQEMDCKDMEQGSSTSITTEISTVATTENSTNECASNDYRPHENDCEAFYRCIQGQLVTVFCPLGTHYNSNTRQCDHPEVAGCVPEEPQSTNSTETTITKTSTYVLYDDSTENQTGTCAEDEYQSDESNCEAFHLCISGRFVKLFCPSGSHYNTNTRQCDEPEKAGCYLNIEESSIYTEAVIVDISTDSCLSDECKLVDGDCEAFYRCINGQFVKLFCPSGTHYNLYTRLCTDPEVAGCDSSDS